MSQPNDARYGLQRSRFQEIIGNMPEKRVLIVGDVGVDRYTIGTASRLSPEAPVPVVAVSSQTDKLGMAANVADNIRAFGAQPFLATLVGDDRVCDELFQLLRDNGISSEHVYRHPSRRTSLKERVIAQTQQVVRIDHEITLPLSREAEDFYIEKITPVIGAFDAVIIEDYGKGLLTDRVARAVIDAAKAAGTFVTVDPTTAVRSPAVYRGVSLFKPNAHEAERLSGIEIVDEESLKRAGAALLQAVEAPIVVITQGKAGMTLFTRGDEPVNIPTFARAVYDVSGAGDTVISMLTLAMVSGASLVEAALLANFAAGVEVGKQGTATVSLEELDQYMEMFGALN
ncbi:MAG: D-glycero-beta-D-manno-heptose-7-phosphate kinase [Proteobacteria bacterium]|nr:MAG: D-glycero-beta-D-manno-heptose-7-phosphate kinase [Pseudomonadota bacterium]